MTPSQQGYLHFCCWGWGQAGQGEQGSEQGRDPPEDAQLVGAGTGRSPTCLICPGWNQALEPLELGPRGGPHLGPASQKARKQKCKFALWEGLGETLAPASPRPPPGHTVFDGQALDAVRLQFLVGEEDPEALEGDTRLHREG